MSREYKVCCSILNKIYAAGRAIADSPEEACEIVRKDHARFPLERSLKDAGGFRFFTVDKFPYEKAAE